MTARPPGEPPFLPVARPSLPDLSAYIRLLEELWESRLLSNFGRFAQEFERKAGAWIGNPACRAVVNCDIGLLLSIAALELPRGSECLVQSFTFNSTINALLWNGLTPVYVDIDRETFNVDVLDLERRIGPKTRAALLTHVFGSPFDVAAVQSVTRSRGLSLVVDAAHAFGAEIGGMRVGDARLGDFQVFSFSGTKPLTSAEGGLIAVGEAGDAGKIDLLRAYGFKNDYISRMVGLNAKMSEIHAALGCLILEETSRIVDLRQAKVERYREALAGEPSIRFQEHLRGARATYKDLAVRCPSRRDALAAHLAAKGIQTKTYFRPLHEMPAYAEFCRREDDLADTIAAASSVLCLPIFNELSDADVERVGRAILEFYGRAGGP